MRTFFLILFLLVLVPLMALFFMSATPVVTLPPSLTALGQSTSITVHVSDHHGIRSAVAAVEQNGSSYKVWDMEQPAHRLSWRAEWRTLCTLSMPAPKPRRSSRTARPA